MRPRRRWLLPLLVAALVFFYRFNALGGVLGGFDNDHFINLARANGLLDGEWPLRDYNDASLQGAWPPLTYLASAGAQLIVGRSLLAEGLLTTGAVAVAAALTFLTARTLGLSTLFALAAVLASVLPSVKLYGYARPVLFAAGCLLFFRYADRPSTSRLVAIAVLGALAFLVRHDYAVYLAFGAAVTILARHRQEVTRGAVRLIACGALAALLLVPTILSVQSIVGLRAYVEGARSLMADETARTNLKWPAFDAAGVLSEQNTIAALYYVFLALPPAAASIALWRAWRGADPSELAKVLGLAAMGAATNHFLLRGNLEGRLADPAVLHALAAMWLAHVASQRSAVERRSVLSLPGKLAAAAIAGVMLVAGGSVGAAKHEFYTAGFHEGPLGTLRTTALVVGRLRAQPPQRWESLPDRGDMLAAAYLSRCTSPADRVINATYGAEFLVFARRRFAAGHVNFVPGFYTSEREQRRAVALASSQDAPVAFTDPPPGDEWLQEDFPIFNAFLRDRYVDAGAIRVGDEPYLHVLVRRGRVSSGTFADTGLPCFQ